MIVFEGCITALITPFKKGQVDYNGLLGLLDFQLANKVNGIVLCATTGEAATLTEEEKARIYKLSVKHIKGRTKLIAGTGSNDTAKTIKQTKAAESAGMDGALIVTPYYNKPTQEGLFLHYRAISQKVKLPIILYHIPGRTSVSMTPETVARIAELRNVVAIKEATGDLDYISRLKELSSITILSGEDKITFPMLCLGGRGTITGMANIVPQDEIKIIDGVKSGDLARARECHLKLLPLVRAIFMETNPIPVKTAMKMMGMIDSAELRLPLCPMGKENAAKLHLALEQYGLI
jgi:4-hydroxy-tetrahydrodipicolinate synthase